MTRGDIKTLVRTLLGTSADDPVYGDQAPGVSAALDPAVQSTVDALIDEIHTTNPGYLSVPAALAPDSLTGNLYTLATQADPILDFARWLELRMTDENGSEFQEANLEDLHNVGSGFFCVTGPDEAAVIQTSPDTQAGVPLWLRYSPWFDDLGNDNAVIPGIPKRFHDVVALETLFVFGVGGESGMPPELRERRKDRHAALIGHISRRGQSQRRTRLDHHASNYLG